MEVIEQALKKVKLTSTTTLVAKPKKIPEKVRAKLTKYVMSAPDQVKPFSQIEVSTRTVIVFTNCRLTLENLFNYIPITDFDPVLKRRGRKKRNMVEKQVIRLPFGSVIRVQYELNVRGVVHYNHKTAVPLVEAVVCPTGKTENKKSYFLHCVVLVIAIDTAEDTENKFKNVKLYSNGKLQITGCKNDEQYIQTMRALFQLFGQIERFTGMQVCANTDLTYRAVFNTVMQNMDFFIGFSICRNKLDQFINANTTFRSIYEGSMNTGVNIKIPVSTTNGKLLAIECSKTTNEVVRSQVNYEDYKHFIMKKGKKEPEHTFLVFATGHIIFTSAGTDMESVYYAFITLMMENRAHFEEQKQS